MFQQVYIRSRKVIFARNEQERLMISEAVKLIRRKRKYIRLHVWQNGELDDRKFDDRVEIWAENGIANDYEAYDHNCQFELSMSAKDYSKLFEDFCEEVATFSGVKLS